MRRFIGLPLTVALLCVLSVLLNLAMFATARHYYVAWKKAALEPVFIDRFRDDNAWDLARLPAPYVVLFGDSRVKHWSPEPVLPSRSILNRGVAGETTAQMIYRFEADVLSLGPEIVVIQGGINDLVAAALAPDDAAGIADRTASNLASMTRLAVSSGIKVVLLTISPPDSPSLLRRLVWSDSIFALVDRANQRILALHHPPSVTVLNVSAVLQTPSGHWRQGVIQDTLHFTSEGYKALNAAIEGTIGRE